MSEERHWRKHRFVGGRRHPGQLLGFIADTDASYLFWYLSQPDHYAAGHGQYRTVARAVIELLTSELSGKKALRFTRLDNPRMTLHQQHEARAKKLRRLSHNRQCEERHGFNPELTKDDRPLPFTDPATGKPLPMLPDPFDETEEPIA